MDCATIGHDAPLAAIAFYDGPPAEQVELAPAEHRAAESQIAVWRFDRDMKPMLACRYRGTDVMLNRPLPPTIRQCTLRIRAAPGLLDPAALRCE